MSEAIGDVAGKIWHYLNENGTSSVTKITTDLDTNKNDVQRAIGWLLKEDKLLLEMKGRTETLTLK